MKAAFSFAGNRIAPVFDVAPLIGVIEGVPDAGNKEMVVEDLGEGFPMQKAYRLVELGIEILVCGAVSRPLHELVNSCGIEVIPFVTGDLDAIIGAWSAGTLDADRFIMPGCYGRRHGKDKKMRNQNVSSGTMLARGGGQGRGGGGRGRGSGSGKGRGSGQGLGRMGGPDAGGTGGNCRCPKCGHTEPHQAGVPCFERSCPECGSMMVRE